MNTIKQDGKTYTSNSNYQCVINNKHYEGWRAAVIMWIPIGVTVLAGMAVCGFFYWMGTL